MPWTKTIHRHYLGNTIGYAGDTIDAEWLLIAPFMPTFKRHGWKRTTHWRWVADAIFCMASFVVTIDHQVWRKYWPHQSQTYS